VEIAPKGERLLKNNKKLFQILVPLVILVAIGGIWFLKDSQKITSAAQDNTPLEITQVDLKTLGAQGLPMMIDFGADACLPCIQMAPALKSVHEKTQGKAVVKFVDVWKHEEAAMGFPVQVIPTQFFIHPDGTPYEPSDEVAIQIPFTHYTNKDSGEAVFTVHQGGLTEEQMLLILKDMGVKTL
jgi:thioredoxin 1